MEIVDNILRYEYLQNAYTVGILIGFIAPILGAYVILKRLALVVDAIAHISMASITLSFALEKHGIMSVSPYIFSFSFSSIGLIFIEKIASTFRTYKEIAIPIIISLSTALMITFSSLAGGFNQDFMSYMFGSILTSTTTDVVIISITTVITVFLLMFFKSQLIVFAIDESYAKHANVNVRIYKTVFNVLLAIFTVLAIKVIGMLLVSALVIIPISSASKICNSFKTTIITGVIFSEISVIFGLILSYYLNIPSGATIVFMNIAIFFCTVIHNKMNWRFI